MRRWAAVAVVLSLVLAVSGCTAVAVDQGLVVHPDGKAELTVTMLVPGIVWAAVKSDPSFSLATLEEELRRTNPELQAQLEEVTEGSQGGIRIRAGFDSVEEAVAFLTERSVVSSDQGEVPIRPFLKDVRLIQEGGR